MKGHVSVELYNGECFRSFRTPAFHVSNNNDRMLVSASWVYYSLDGMHFTDIYVPHDDDKLLLTVCRDYYSLDGVYLSGVAYVRANSFALSCKTNLGAAQVLHIEVRYPSLKADSTPRYYRRYADYG